MGCRMATARRLHDHSCHCVLAPVGFADRRTVFLAFWDIPTFLYGFCRCFVADIKSI